LILGIVLGVLVLAGIIAGLGYGCHPMEEEPPPPDDPNAEFFWLQQKDQQTEMSVDFNNPVYVETVAQDGDGFDSNPDEML
jgi:hypothetical protein